MKITITKTILAMLAGFGAAGAQAQTVQPELTDGSVPYATYGPWTFYQTSSEAFNGQLSCAAVAAIPGSYDAIRIERVAEGYIYGVNGFSRESFGENGEYPLAIWFDGDPSGGVETMARFVKDPAFPNDDWLSEFRATEDYDSPLNGFLLADQVTFAVPNPGNRTGNDVVTTSFPLGTFEVVQRGLDRCYDMGLMFAANTEGPIAPCRDDGTRLPLSGLCRSEANVLMQPAEGPEPALYADSCSWALNEAWLAGDILLYRAAACSGRVSRLYGGAGAHMAQLELIETAYHEDGSDFGKLEEPVLYADVYTRFKDSPAEDVQARALYGREGEVPASCAARRLDEVSDGYVVDVSPAERARQPQDEPPAHLCGDYGYGDDADLWRVFQGYAWFLRLGQESYQDIDYRSLTLVTMSEDGSWYEVP